MDSTNTKRKESTTDWEELDIKPAIDLIPDEFLRKTNENMLVELVHGEDDSKAVELQRSLEELGYNVSTTDRDRNRMESKPDDNWIRNVLQKAQDKELDGLIMIFAKVAYKNEDMKNVWSCFTSSKCPKLKNKPKIFIFQNLKRGVDGDGTATTLNWSASYETPAEADILIILEKFDQDRQDLLQQLYTGIEDYGDKEDIFTLASLNYEFKYQPLLISTMTRKFYFKVHNQRGRHLSVHRKFETITEQLEQLKKQVTETKFKDTNSIDPLITFSLVSISSN